MPGWAISRSLVAIGRQLALSNAMFAMSVMVDRFFVAASLPEQFGQYTFAATVVVGWSAVQGILSQAVSARVLHSFGAGATVPAIRRRLMRTVALVGVASVA